MNSLTQETHSEDEELMNRFQMNMPDPEQISYVGDYL